MIGAGMMGEAAAMIFNGAVLLAIGGLSGFTLNTASRIARLEAHQESDQRVLHEIRQEFHSFTDRIEPVINSLTSALAVLEASQGRRRVSDRLSD
jgi:hypothetical protein